MRCQIRLSSARCDKGRIFLAITTNISAPAGIRVMLDGVLQPSNMVTEMPLPASIYRRCHRDTLARSESNLRPAMSPNERPATTKVAIRRAQSQHVHAIPPARGIFKFLLPPERAAEVPGTVPQPPSARKRTLHRSKHFLYLHKVIQLRQLHLKGHICSGKQMGRNTSERLFLHPQ